MNKFIRKQRFKPSNSRMYTENDFVLLEEDVYLVVKQVIERIEDAKLSELGSVIEKLKQEYK